MDPIVVRNGIPLEITVGWYTNQTSRQIKKISDIRSIINQSSGGVEWDV